MPLIDHQISDYCFSNEIQLVQSNFITSEGKDIPGEDEDEDDEEDDEYNTDEDDFDHEEAHDVKEANNNTALSASLRHVIVFPFAEKTLEHMLADFTLSPEKLRKILMDVAKALAYFHQRGVLYANLRPSHIVFFSGKVRLIDLDYCVNMDENEEYKDEPVDLDEVLARDSPAAGNGRFVTGVMPPELVTILKTEGDLQQYQSAVLEKSTPEEGNFWNEVFYRKLLPQRCIPSSKSGKKCYAVKSFCTENIAQPLPYDLVAAMPTYDVWSFGTLAYQLFSNGTPLFTTNRSGDLASLQDLYDFDPEAKLCLLHREANEIKFLKTLLAYDPQDRYRTMNKVLRDDYFKKKLPSRTLSMNEIMLQQKQKQSQEEEEEQETSEDVPAITGREEEIQSVLEQLNKKIKELTSQQEDTTRELKLKNKEIQLLKSENISLTVDVEKAAQKFKSAGLVQYEMTDSVRPPNCCVQ